MNNLKWVSAHPYTGYGAEYECEHRWFFDVFESNGLWRVVVGCYDDNENEHETVEHLYNRAFDTMQSAKLACELFIDGSMYREKEYVL
jgi:hypothetical protein